MPESAILVSVTIFAPFCSAFFAEDTASLEKHRFSAAFEEQHRAELTAYRAAAAYFKANNLTKLPSPKKLEAEYAQLASEKAKFYEQYKEAKEELLKLKTAKQNVASFFREEEQTQQER